MKIESRYTFTTILSTIAMAILVVMKLSVLMCMMCGLVSHGLLLAACSRDVMHI